MKWKDALTNIIEERVREIEKETGTKQTALAEKSELPRNFFTRLFRGEIRRLDLDEELEPLAKLLGFRNVLELLALASASKKNGIDNKRI